MRSRLTIPVFTAAALFCAGPALFAQQVGSSNPAALNDNITDPPPDAQSHYVKPSAKPSPDVPMVTAQPTPAPALQTRIPASQPVPEQTAVLRRDPVMTVTDDDPNSGVVMAVPSGPNELPMGTLLRAQLAGEISTKTTAVESRFSARLTADVFKDGRVLLPAGTLVNGRVTFIHGGSRMSGPAAIRLQPDIVKLPNGQAYELEAEVVDLDNFREAHVNSEGTIIGNDRKAQTATTFGATTGGGALIGAAVGGGVGAVVGAGIGAGISTVWWLRHDRQQTLPEGTSIVFSLDRNLLVAPIRLQ